MTLVSHPTRPYPGYLWTVVRHSAVMWLLVRLMFAVVAGPLLPSFGIPALLVWIDRKRNHEQLLQANLGASELWFWSASLLTTVVLDLAALLATLALLNSFRDSLAPLLLG